MRRTAQLLAAVALVGSACAAAGSPSYFTATDTPGEFRLDTGSLEGKLREGGRSFGLAPLVHTPTQTAIAAPLGVFNYYRVFTANHRHGESMRGRPSEARLVSPKVLEVIWSPADDCPFTLKGRYAWSGPGTLDLETVVTAHAPLPDFEVFLAAYFAEGFPAGAVYAKPEDGGPRFMTAEKPGGVWQVFPRDAGAGDLIHDGRWSIPPSPVDWQTTAEFAAPVACRRNPETGVTVVVMARPEDCFAVFTPERGEGHRSLYLSLFGRTLHEGETARANARLIAGTGLDDAAILDLYRAYTRQAEPEKEVR